MLLVFDVLSTQSWLSPLIRLALETIRRVRSQALAPLPALLRCWACVVPAVPAGAYTALIPRHLMTASMVVLRVLHSLSSRDIVVCVVPAIAARAFCVRPCRMRSVRMVVGRVIAYVLVDDYSTNIRRVCILRKLFFVHNYAPPRIGVRGWAYKIGFSLYSLERCSRLVPTPHPVWWRDTKKGPAQRSRPLGMSYVQTLTVSSS